MKLQVNVSSLQLSLDLCETKVMAKGRDGLKRSAQNFKIIFYMILPYGYAASLYTLHLSVWTLIGTEGLMLGFQLHSQTTNRAPHEMHACHPCVFPLLLTQLQNPMRPYVSVNYSPF